MGLGIEDLEQHDAYTASLIYRRGGLGRDTAVIQQ